MMLNYLYVRNHTSIRVAHIHKTHTTENTSYKEK